MIDKKDKIHCDTCGKIAKYEDIIVKYIPDTPLTTEEIIHICCNCASINIEARRK